MMTLTRKEETSTTSTSEKDVCSSNDKNNSEDTNQPKIKIVNTTRRKTKLGSRSARRLDNLNFLLGLVENEEYGEFDVYNFMEPTVSAFAKILSDQEKMELWDDFINHTEEEQELILKEADEKFAEKNKKPVEKTEPIDTAQTDAELDDLRIAHPAFTAEESYRRIDRNLRAVLKQGRFAKGVLSHLENEVSGFFTEWPTSVFISHLKNGFERLLLHAVCQYLDLMSQSVNRGRKRHTQVENKHDYFSPPVMSLTTYLENKETKH